MVPKGDYSQQKLIIGKYTAMNSTPFVYTEPLDTMIEVKGESFLGVHSMVANGTEPSNDIASPTVVKIYETSKGPYVGFDRLGISAAFQAWLEPFDTVTGSYGLRMYIYTDETNTSAGAQEEDAAEKKQRIYSMTLSNADMYGNPYNFEGFFTQSKVFDISDINNIVKIEVYMFQNGDFYDGNGNLIPHGNIIQDTNTFELLPDNIFIKDLKVLVGYDENDFDKDTLILYTDDSLTYNNKNSDAEANKKTIYTRWIHKNESGKFELLEQTDGAETCLRWYRYNYGSPAADKYSGVYWDRVRTERIAEADLSPLVTQLDTFYLTFCPRDASSAYNESTYIRGMRVPYKNGTTYTLNNSTSLLRNWSQECLDYYGISDYVAEHSWAWTSTTYLKVSSQTWEEIFHSRMVWHEENMIWGQTMPDTYIGDGIRYPCGCMHPISFWELLTTAYKFYWKCPEEFEKMNLDTSIFNGGDQLSWWDPYRGKNPYTELSYDNGSSGYFDIYVDTDHSQHFDVGVNNALFRTFLKNYADSFGEWALIPDDYNRMNMRPVDNNVYNYLYERVEAFFKKMDNPTYVYYTDAFDYTLEPDITKQQEQVKVIGLVKSGVDINGNPTYTPYYSNLLTFENEQEVASQATIDAVSALQIVCEDGTDGNYFIYDQNGRLNDDSEGRGKTRTMRALYRGAEITAETGITDIEWHIPKDFSMMAIDEEEHCSAASKVEYFYENVRKPYTSIRYAGNNLHAGTNNVIKTQQYYITDYWNNEKSNNTVECIATIDGITYTAVKEFQFGKAGTTGTNATFVLSFEGNRNSLSIEGITSNDEKVYDLNDEEIVDINDSVLMAAGISDAFATINAKLYDSANKEINLTDIHAEIEWGWKDDYDNPYIEIGVSDEDYSATLTLRNSLANQPVPIDNYSILKATLKDWVSENGTFDLVAYLPIPIKSNNEYKYISGTKEVIYDSNGTPNYSALPYHLYRNADDIVSTTWGINSQNYQYDIAHNMQGVLQYYHALRVTKDGTVFQALNFYLNGGDDFCCVYAQKIAPQDDPTAGQILWSQPILITQNQYDFAMLNQWDGNLTIDEENGIILSKMVGAGKKNSDDNTFSGVLMGDVQAGTGNNLVRETGIYGFDRGVMSFQLRESGKAIFGASGRGQIIIDGNKGTLESASYSNNIENLRQGMQIDLDDGVLDIIDRTQEIDGKRQLEILIQPKDPFFKITSPRGTNLINIGISQYYLRSDDYNATDKGFNLNLKDGRIDAYNFKLVSGKVVFDSTEGNHPYFYVANKNNNGYLIYLGPNENYIASNDYSSTSGMIIDLESSRIVGRGLYIQGTSGAGQNFTLNASDGSYPMTIGSLFKVNWQGKLECEEAIIRKAYIYDAQIQNGVGNTNVNINENFKVDSSGNCTANSLNASQGGTIGPYGISSGALTGNGVSLEKDKIIIGNITLYGHAQRLGVSAGIYAMGDCSISGKLACTSVTCSSITFGSGDEGEGDTWNGTDAARAHSIWKWFNENSWQSYKPGDFAKTTDISDMATKSWVNSQGFLKSLPSHTHSQYATDSHWHYDSEGGQTTDARYSSKRYKTDINSLSLNLDDFHPVEYKYNTEFLDPHHDDDRIHYGFIAEELEEINPDLIVYNEEGQPDKVDYTSIIALCVKEIQELKKEISELKEKMKQ